MYLRKCDLQWLRRNRVDEACLGVSLISLPESSLSFLCQNRVCLSFARIESVFPLPESCLSSFRRGCHKSFAIVFISTAAVRSGRPDVSISIVRFGVFLTRRSLLFCRYNPCYDSHIISHTCCSLADWCNTAAQNTLLDCRWYLANAYWIRLNQQNRKHSMFSGATRATGSQTWCNQWSLLYFARQCCSHPAWLKNWGCQHAHLGRLTTTTRTWSRRRTNSGTRHVY